MKNKTVVALIVAVVLIFTGGILFVLGISYAGGSKDMVSHTEKTYIVSEPFDSIQVDTTICDVTFVKTDGEFRVVCPDFKTLDYTVIVEEDTLYIRQIDLRQWYAFIGINLKYQEITVYLPETQYDALRVETDTGDITLPDSFTLSDAELLTSTGEISCAAQVSDILSVHTSTGDIRVQGCTPAKAQVSATTGEITLRDMTCGDCSVSATTGDVELTGVLLAGDLLIQTSTGDVTVLNCDGENVDIQTDTGDVYGNFLTSKWFQTTTDTGHVSVPMTRDGGLCCIETNTGDITFTYQP